MDDSVKILFEDTKLQICLEKVNCLCNRNDILPQTKRALRLFESLSANDWSKFGVMFAILWAKIDRVIELIDKSGKTDEQSLKELQKITTEIRNLSRKT